MDWIKAHFECSLEHALRVLRERVKADVEQWQQLSPETAKINLTMDGPRTIISRPVYMSSGPWASFARSENSILVQLGSFSKSIGALEVKEIRLIPTVNVQGECRLRHGPDELEFWQASRLILEGVLFN